MSVSNIPVCEHHDALKMRQTELGVKSAELRGRGPKLRLGDAEVRHVVIDVEAGIVMLGSVVGYLRVV